MCTTIQVAGLVTLYSTVSLIFHVHNLSLQKSIRLNEHTLILSCSRVTSFTTTAGGKYSGYTQDISSIIAQTPIFRRNEGLAGCNTEMTVMSLCLFKNFTISKAVSAVVACCDLTHHHQLRFRPGLYYLFARILSFVFCRHKSMRVFYCMFEYAELAGHRLILGGVFRLSWPCKPPYSRI